MSYNKSIYLISCCFDITHFLLSEKSCLDKVALSQLLTTKQEGFFKPIFSSHWANRNNLSLRNDDKVKTKIRKALEKIIPVRRKRVEARLTPNWDFSSIPILSSKFINQVIYSTSPYKHLNLSCSQKSFQFFFSNPSFSDVLSHLSLWQLHSSTCSAQTLDQPPSFLKVKCPHWSPCFFPYLPKVIS